MEEGIISIKGVKVFYKITGEGRPFLILHGWGSDGEKWEKTAEILGKKGIKTIIPDLPGFGKSQKPTEAWSLDEYCKFLKDFTDFLNLDKFYLLGHSFGGALAVKYALNFPSSVQGLFLVGAALIRRKTLKKKILFLTSKLFKVFSFLPLYSYFRKGFYRFIVGKSDYSHTEGVMKESYLKIIKEDLFPKLSSVNIPTTIIWGQKDRITPLWEAVLIKKEIRNSKIVIIERGEHDLERGASDILAEKILENLF